MTNKSFKILDFRGSYLNEILLYFRECCQYVNAYTQMERTVSLKTTQEKKSPTELCIPKAPNQIFELFHSYVVLKKNLLADERQINYLTMFYVYLSINFEYSDTLTR